MTVAIKVPSVGESITEGMLANWHKKNGEFLHEGDPLFELETDKATTTVPAPATGKLQIAAKEGDTVAIGAVVGQIDDHAAAPTADAAKPAKPAMDTQLPPTSPKPAVVPPPTVAPAPVPVTRQEFAAPIQDKSGTGQQRPSERRERMSPIRQRIAERLLASQKGTATLTTFNEADMSAVLSLRAKYKEMFKDTHHASLGMMPFFVKAVVAGLKAVPVVNAFIDGSDVVYHDAYHIGVAVSTEKGLMVPVLRDAEHLTFVQIDKAIADLAVRARDGKISVQDLQGGTFTITNGGVFGSLLSTPIQNPPQSAILGMHTIQKRAVVVDDQIVIRPMMYLAVSYDHRLIDGREAVQFLLRVKECIEAPARLLLEM